MVTEETERIVRQRFEDAQKPLLERIVGPDRQRFSLWVLYFVAVEIIVSLLVLLAMGG
jgi:hypothetical protein